MENTEKRLAERLDDKAQQLYDEANYTPSPREVRVESLDELVRRLSVKLLERAAFNERIAEDPVPEVTSKDYDDIVKNNKVVFLFFTADWCAPCISFMEVFRSVALKYLRPGVFFGRVDVDRSFGLADRLGVEHIPTIMVIVDGTPVGTMVGRSSRQRLEEFVRAYIEKAGV